MCIGYCSYVWFLREQLMNKLQFLQKQNFMRIVNSCVFGLSAFFVQQFLQLMDFDVKVCVPSMGAR